ncbi:MAG: hypothetical protein A2161_05660 [Candidatus Schekmanbacteria bacterium RBG_13_48_7]|uniref:Uncharacterized protein n=1 Tax=Candidatus Schekmanbacteria bacterium RBG_13_48_7 TaxID=1817878 RepID=A0A1F7S1J7_9BACT|nr:MAG: hypothetical protein A2161_05660 [Candidatus Schekmanbacteria bacterium RBG_13_48_7]
MFHSEETPKKRVSTLQGTALILSIFSLIIILLKIYPDLNNNVRDTSEMFSELDRRLDEANLRLDRISRHIFASKFDEEILKLKRAGEVLEEIALKSSGETAMQAKLLQDKINSLILQLQKESISSIASKVQ